MLYLVATPIGNLGDISQRALDTLQAVDVIACEDTRYSGVMFKRFGISKPTISFHEHNEDRAVGQIVSILEQGRDVAVVTDAGTPGVSDPGFAVVRACVERGLPCTMIPGAAAFVMAVVLSGLPSHAFTFRGFPPRKSGARKRFLDTDLDSPHTLVFYESPFRVRDLLQDAIAVYGDRRAALANDLTKMFERVDRGLLSELLALANATEPRGEYVLVVEGAPTRKPGTHRRERGEPEDARAD